MIIKNVHIGWLSLKNISHSKCKFWMIRTYVEDSEHLIISPQLELNLLSVLCLWDWMKGGIKFSLTYQILPVGLMAPIIYKPFESLFMQTAESVEFTFQIVCIVRKNSHQNLSSSFLSRNSNDIYTFITYISLLFLYHLIFPI